MERLAVYAGSFDPLTNGHLWMIEQGARLFDKLIVAIGVNPKKRAMFSAHERLDMLVQATKHLPNILTEMFPHQFLIHYAMGRQCRFVLRGIRDETDYPYERKMRNVNGDLAPEISTVFLMPPRDLVEVSSSFVKELVGPQWWERVVEKYVPPIVLEKIKEKYHASKSV